MVTSQDNHVSIEKDSLVILVSTDKHLDHLISLTSAAFAKGIRVKLFFTGSGVLLTMASRFGELAGIADVSICEASFREYGLDEMTEGIPERTADWLTTHAQHAELLEQADRHVVL